MAFENPSASQVARAEAAAAVQAAQNAEATLAREIRKVSKWKGRTKEMESELEQLKKGREDMKAEIEKLKVRAGEYASRVERHEGESRGGVASLGLDRATGTENAFGTAGKAAAGNPHARHDPNDVKYWMTNFHKIAEDAQSRVDSGEFGEVK